MGDGSPSGIGCDALAACLCDCWEKQKEDRCFSVLAWVQ